VAIYDSTLVSSAPLVTSGAVTGKMNATAGLQTIAITPTTLKAGQVYFAAFSYGAVGGTAATCLTGLYSSGQQMKFFGSSLPNMPHDTKASTHPLTAAWGAAGNATAVWVLLALLEA
jgi:hypothetical protein